MMVVNNSFKIYFPFLRNLLFFLLTHTFIIDPSFENSTNSLLLPPSRLYRSDGKRTNSFSPPTMRRDFRKILSVKSALNVRMRTTSVSPLDNALMMSVELENNTDAGGSFSVEVVNVEIAYGFVT